MFDKNKNNTNRLEQYAGTVAAHIGLAVMSMTAVVSLLELHEARMPRFTADMPLAQASAMSHKSPARHENPAGHGGGHSNMEERLRREKEEIRHALVSYGTTMRSHPTTGPA